MSESRADAVPNHPLSFLFFLTVSGGGARPTHATSVPLFPPPFPSPFFLPQERVHLPTPLSSVLYIFYSLTRILLVLSHFLPLNIFLGVSLD